MAAIEIGTIQELIAFGNGDYGRGSSGNLVEAVLTADLDFADLTEYDMPYVWSGCTGDWYVNFDGQGHTIGNIYYAGSIDRWGFFSVLKSGSIVKNLNLPNMYVAAQCGNADGGVGSIASIGEGCTIQNCHVSGQIENTRTDGDFNTSNNCVAGIVGRPGNNSTTINCSFSGTLKIASTSGHIHGIAGHGYNGGCSVISCLCVADFVYLTGAAGIGIKCYGNNGATLNSEFRGTNAAIVFGFGNTINCIGIVDSSDDALVAPDTVISSYIDSTKAAAAGLTIPSNCGSATTAELQSINWLRAHNFPI